MTTVLHRHARELGYCNRGMRAFAKRCGIDWAKFVREGIDAGELRKIDDAMAARIVEHAEREVNGQQ